MRRSLTLLATVAILIGLVPAAALATPPVTESGGDAFSGPDAYMTAECGFDVSLAVEYTYTMRTFFDKDGAPVRLRFHESGETLWTSDNGEAWENYTVNTSVDLVDGTETFIGNVWNLHAGAGGIRVNDSGRIVLGGSEVIVNGPHQAWDGDFAGLCEALS